MLGYVIALLAVSLFWLDPLLELLAGFGGPGRDPGAARRRQGGRYNLRKMPRPELNEALLALEDDGELWNSTDSTGECPPDAYAVHIFSKAPLVLYIEGFLGEGERAHLLEISEPLYEPSTVTHDGGASQRDAAVRDSEVALLPRTAAVRCVERRARALQGWRGELWLERLRAQRYLPPGGHYAHHFDWSRVVGGAWGRVSSFMVFVDDGGGELQGGGTEFPLLRRPADRRWCRFVECPAEGVEPEPRDGNGDGNADGDGDGEDVLGVVFKPVPGNAVFWENFRLDGSGRGYDETWHAGLPVTAGVKVGLNIWSWGRID